MKTPTMQDVEQTKTMREAILRMIVEKEFRPENAMAAMTMALGVVLVAVSQDPERLAVATSPNGPVLLTVKMAVEQELEQHRLREQAKKPQAEAPKQEPRWGVL